MDRIRKRLDRSEEGFTLIELMVVVLIIAILIAIAIPTFLGARQKAQDKQAQSNVRNALVTEDVFYVDAQVYTDVNATLDLLEPQLDWGSPTAAAAGVMAYVDDTTATLAQTLVLSSTSASGTVFCLGKTATGVGVAGTFYSKTAGCNATHTAAEVAAWSPTTTGGW